MIKVTIRNQHDEILEEIRVHNDGGMNYAAGSSLKPHLVRIVGHDPEKGYLELLKRALQAFADYENG